MALVDPPPLPKKLPAQCIAEVLSDLLAHVLAVLAAVGSKPFLLSGSLIGAVRGF